MATSVEPVHLPDPAPGLIFRRALRLRCPLCGGRAVLLSWFTVASSCPSCGLHLDRDEPGYWIGSYTVNLFLTEGFLALALLAGILVTWPAVPWTLLTVVCSVLAIGLPILVFPHTKMLYLAIDLIFRPADSPDLATPAEPAFLTRKG
jgi:uncharacterized protein (DUF983 family)